MPSHQARGSASEENEDAGTEPLVTTEVWARALHECPPGAWARNSLRLPPEIVILASTLYNTALVVTGHPHLLFQSTQVREADMSA